MFLQVCVILLTGGVSTWPPLKQTPLQQTLPTADTPPPHHKAFREIGSTRGRYASYWNAILLYIFILIKINVSEKDGSDHLYLFTYANCLFLHMVFVLIFIIYLFIYSKRCQQKQRKSPPVFIYLCKSLVVAHDFRFNIHYLFVYLFKLM